MRLLISIFLIITIVYTTIGVKINAHHCNLKQQTSYAYFDVTDCCDKVKHSCPLHQKKDDCCTDKINLLHLGQDIHFNPESTKPSDETWIGFAYTFFFLETNLKSLNKQSVLKGRAPPFLILNNDFHSLYQVYTI